jgi:hypothetical protein
MRRTGYAVKTLNADNQPTKTKVMDLGAAFDAYAVMKRNAADLSPGTLVTLARVVEGRTMDRTVRWFETPAPAPVVKEKVALEPIKLSDAMRAALDSDDTGIMGLAGKANTLKALEARGLVKIQNDGVARLTDLGRQYRRV